jgi:signal transduction histidine kinase
MFPRELAAATRLVAAIQELSLARDLAMVMQIVRRAARELTGADGATFVLRDGTHCYYADEDAISPLWKGARFPLGQCISGWVMMNRTAAVIPDIYQDPRIPVEAYRPTFVKSLAMVPIREKAPIAAIGNYWATPHKATAREIWLLQALANSTSVAMENIEMCADLERRVQHRTQELEAANRELEETNRELETFAHSASHDLRAPLRAIQHFAAVMAEDSGNVLSAESRACLARIEQSSERMSALLRDLLSLARLSTATITRREVNLSLIADEILRGCAMDAPARNVAVTIAPNAVARCDPGLVRIVLDNLLSNAWKFTAQTARAHIEFGYTDGASGREFFVRDNGAGFDAAFRERLFQPFQRLHADAAFAGFGLGLATVRRIVSKHGGSVHAHGTVNAGATFAFTLPNAAPTVA